MRWTLCTLCLLIASVFGSSATSSEEIKQLDTYLVELKDKKRGFEARALRAEDQADRLQFEDQFLLETRRFYKIADENRRKAQMVQEEIDRIEKRKAELLKKE